MANSTYRFGLGSDSVADMPRSSPISSILVI